MKNEDTIRPNFVLSLAKTFIPVGISYLVSIILLLIFALIASMAGFNDGMMRGGVLFVTVLSAVFSGIFAGKRADHKGWLFGMIAGLIYMFILYIVSALAFNGPAFSFSTILMFVIAALSGAFGGMLGVSKKNTYRR